jgi:MerR family transcriptional regulator, heat shock protein HspR
VSSGAKRYHTISWVAERYSLHPQTLRVYEREGLLRPPRSVGNTRLYDDDTCQQLEFILTLTREMGVNLAGVEVILNMRDQVAALQAEVERLLVSARREAERRGMIAREHALAPREPRGLVPTEDE